MKKIFLLIAILLFAASANAQLNAKTMDYVKVSIVQSGSLQISGNVEKANLSYYIPQEGITDIAVTGTAMTWRYVNDSFGNTLVLLEWKKPSGTVNYSINIAVENTAKHLYADTTIGYDNSYLAATNSIKINDAIKQAAFPFEKSMKKAADLTSFVNNYLTYDLAYVGRNLPSDQVLAERRGVCVEHANLLTAMLRANGIPTRYIVGYAYSSVQGKFIGHTWVEVLTQNGWVPFDPTWLEGGYLDATHIKSANLLDNSQIDTLTYLGGSIAWHRNDEQIQLLDYTTNDITSLSASGTNKVASGDYGYIKTSVSTSECTLSDVTANTCVDSSGARQLNVLQQNRTLWICGPEDVYWFFSATGTNYICPVSIYDQIGGSAEFRVTVEGRAQQTSVFISGPQTVLVNELFTLTASTDGIFYSPDFGLRQATGWRLSIKSPGTYKFYLYSNGGLYVKNVNVVQQKEFDLGLEAPGTAKLNTNFYVNVTVRNLLNATTATATIQYTNQTATRTLVMEKGDTQMFAVRLTANKLGDNELSVSVAGNSLATQSVVVNTPQEKGVLDNIWTAIANFFSTLADGIRSLFGG